MHCSDHFTTCTKSCRIPETSITCALVISHYTGSKNRRKVKPWPQGGCFSRMRWPMVHESPMDNRGIYLSGWGFSLEVRYGHLHFLQSSGWPLEGGLVSTSQSGLCSTLECLAHCLVLPKVKSKFTTKSCMVSTQWEHYSTYSGMWNQSSLEKLVLRRNHNSMW